MISCKVFNRSTVIDIFITPPFIDRTDYKKKRLVSLLCKLLEVKPSGAATQAHLRPSALPVCYLRQLRQA